MKKRSKRARESLTLVQLAQRLVVGVGFICLFFLGIYLLNQWYLYSRSHENQAPVPQLSTEHPDNLTPEVNPDQCANEPDLTFFDKLALQEPSHAPEPSMNTPSSSPEKPKPPAVTPRTSQPKPLQPSEPPHPSGEPTPGVEKTFYTIQAGSFRQRDGAQNLMNILKEKGFTPFITPIKLSDNEIWYRVRIGESLSRQEAEKIAQKIINAGGGNPLILTVK